MILIRKRSKKPFKNGDKMAYAISEILHPITNNPAWVLADGSHVEKRMCVVVE